MEKCGVTRHGLYRDLLTSKTVQRVSIAKPFCVTPSVSCFDDSAWVFFQKLSKWRNYAHFSG